MPKSSFYSAKCIFRNKDASTGESFFEERIILLKAKGFDEAFEKAKLTSNQYVTQKLADVFLGCVGVFLIQDPLEDGVEVFSMLRVCDRSDSAFLNRLHTTGKEFDSLLFRTEPGLDAEWNQKPKDR